MRIALVMLSVLALTTAAGAEDAPAEIDYLLTTVGSSDCEFIRNGKRYDAKDAEDHLRMKYRRGKRYAPTTEAFIERLASKSSMSKKPYHIECPDAEPMTSGEWLHERLAEYRAARQDAQ